VAEVGIPRITGIAFDSLGVLYAADLQTNTLHVIDKVAGDWFAVGPIGPMTGKVTGLAFEAYPSSPGDDEDEDTDEDTDDDAGAGRWIEPNEAEPHPAVPHRSLVPRRNFGR